VERATPPKFRARAHASVMSVSESLESRFRCPECGAILGLRPALYRPQSRLYDADGSCASCYLASGKHEGGIVATGRNLGSSEELEERHTRLFEAARALLQDRTVGEDEIFPTLKLASKMGRFAFTLLYRDVEMVKAVGGVPVLRRNPVQAHGVRSIRSSDEAITAVVITVTPSGRSVGADGVARAYERALREEGMAWGGTGGRVTSLFASDMLQLEVEELDEFAAKGDERRWPSPTWVGKSAHGALEEFKENLIFRKGGGDMSSDALILAMVARILADAVPRKGKKINRKEIHRLLGTHVIPSAPGKKTLGVSDQNRERKLWSDVEKVGRMERHYEPGPMLVF
jgi:predicted RNA-binding Zn-ribbon protein involved in translation (DUF1610 family)